MVRSWKAARAKVEREGRCRVSGCVTADWRLEAAHTIGRIHDDGDVDPDDVVPLCQAHHYAYDHRQIDLLPYLSHAEQAAAVRHVGMMAAFRRITGSPNLPRM